MSPPHPRDLAPKEIGLWYKERSLKKNRDQVCEEIVLPEEIIDKLEKLLSNMDNNTNLNAVSSKFEKHFQTTIRTSFEDYLKMISFKNIKSEASNELSQISYDPESIKGCDATETNFPKQNPINSVSGSFSCFKRDPENSDKLFSQYNEKTNTIEHQFRAPLEVKEEIPSFRRQFSTNKFKQTLSLPVFEHRNEILHALKDSCFILISGDTGCGKTTQIPQIILDHFLENNNGASCNIICAQPRRISAITVAERVALERNERLGKSVGYSIRLEKCLPNPKNGSILYCTTGVLLRQIESNPLMTHVSHIILDEIHERNIESDIIIGLLQKIVLYNKELRVILMSATFGTAKFAKHFGNCSIINIRGTLFPIEIRYLEDALEETQFFDFQDTKKSVSRQSRSKKSNKEEALRLDAFKSFMEPYARSLHDIYSPRVIRAIQNIETENINLELILALIQSISNNQPDGSILVFLPGYDKISKLYELLKYTREYRHGKFILYTLHSMMPTADQRGVFEKPYNGVRKIVLATNIAETSLTIEDIVYVINSGRIKIKNYDVELNYETLLENWIARAHSQQRQGRAGRCQPGVCYHLYTRAREYVLDDYGLPEIQRTRLEPVILKLKMLKIHDLNEFFQSLVSSPHEKTIENSITLLKRINALNEDESLTPLGLHLANLPLDPQIGKMLLISAIFKCVEPTTTIASALSFKDPFYMPIGKEKEVRQVKEAFANSAASDHLMHINILHKFELAKRNNSERNFCYNNFLAGSTLNQLVNMKRQLFENIQAAGFVSSDPIKCKNSNLNSKNEKLLRSIITAGLYPNVAYIKKIRAVKNRVIRAMNIVTPDDGKKVEIHPASVNYGASNFDSKYLMYFNKQKTTNLYLYDTTNVHPISLAIFGDQFISGSLGNNKLFFSIAEQLRFQVDQPTLNIITELRNRFDIFLRKMALDPNVINSDSETDKNLIDALILLLSYEENDE